MRRLRFAVVRKETCTSKGENNLRTEAFHGNPVSGSPLCVSSAQKGSELCVHGGADAGPWDWCEHGYFQSGEFASAQAAPGTKPQADCDPGPARKQRTLQQS